MSSAGAYVRAGLPKATTALAVLTGEPQPLAPEGSRANATGSRCLQPVAGTRGRYWRRRHEPARPAAPPKSLTDPRPQLSAAILHSHLGCVNSSPPKSGL